MKQQAHIFDIHVMRAVGCLMVVLVHVSALYYVQHGDWQDVILFLNQASRFGTPIFAIVSGLLLFLQVRNKGFFFQRFLFFCFFGFSTFCLLFRLLLFRFPRSLLCSVRYTFVHTIIYL